MSFRNFVFLFALTGLSLNYLLPAPAAGADPGSTAERLAVVLKASQILNSDSRLLNVYAAGDRVTVMVHRSEPGDDRTLKIDAMFIARTLFNAYPGGIGDVRVLYSTAGGQEGKVVSVSTALVRDFSAGKIAPDALLNRLNVEGIEPEAAPDVVQGACQDRRLLIWQRIKILQDGGTSVKPFLTLFQDMEAKVKAGNRSEILAAAGNLEDKLSEQEEQVMLARKTAAGRGILAKGNKAGDKSSSSDAAKGRASTASDTASSTAGGATLSNGGISKPTSIAGVPVVELLNAPPVRFMELACMDLEQRRDGEAQRYRERKQRIEDTFRNVDQRRAEADYCNFKSDFLRKMGLSYTVCQPANQSTLWGGR